MKNPILIAVLVIASSAVAQQYSIDWHKISSGGGASGNGQYAVSGTIGQHDAGGPMTGGTYSLTGGFWSLVSVVQTPGAPLLTITYSPSQATVSWPPAATGWILQTNSNPGTAATWADYGGVVTNNSVIIYPNGESLFFRLSNH